MDIKGIGNLLASLAPMLATGLAGPIAGTAVTALEAALGIKVEGTLADRQTALVGAVKAATPDQLLAIKQADGEYAIKMAELGFKNKEVLAALETGDRDSARKRETVIVDITPKVLAYTLTLGFFLVLGFMLFMNVPDGSRDLLNILLGMLATSFSGVIAYYFGSSASSSEKNKLLAESTPPPK